MRSPKRSVLAIEFDFNFSLVAIESKLEAHSISIFLNRLLGTDLHLASPLESGNGKSQEVSYFIAYISIAGDEPPVHLISNRSLSVVKAKKAHTNKSASLFEEDNENLRRMLLPELENIDYLLIIKSDDHQKLAQSWYNEIKNANFAAQVRIVDPSTLPSKENIIL